MDRMAEQQILHVFYGDELAARFHELGSHADSELVVREALRDGPLVPSPNEDPAGFIAARARHLAAVHGADEAEAAAELRLAWRQIAEHTGPVVLYVDEQPCIDCATFAACALETLHRAGRGTPPDADTGVRICHGGDPAKAEALRGQDVAAGAGIWRLLVAGDEADLTLAATDLEGTGGIHGYRELPGLLLRRVRGDVPLEEVHPA
jgi:hypothetical protein